MYSRCRTEILACSLLLAGCGAAPHGAPAPPQPSAGGVIASAIVPGREQGASTRDPRAASYYENPQAVVEGKRLFTQYNCSGCHSNGGGGMGPDLMDDEWIYGDRLEQIHQTLVEGRPNGMPAWGGKIPDAQLWALAAYVRSMSLPDTIAANTGNTPSQRPAPVPRDADDDDGWSPPPPTTNKYTDLLEGPK
ncbi:MAG: c-type cytochrome [Gammaproteobacteria bacterium]|nr:c-type cytochrome [Gammaproteobacteria bacterium]